MHSDLWRRLLQQHQQGLQHQVGEAWADGHVVEQTLDVVHHHAAELGLVGVVKHLGTQEMAGKKERKTEKKKARKAERKEENGRLMKEGQEVRIRRGEIVVHLFRAA